MGVSRADGGGREQDQREGRFGGGERASYTLSAFSGWWGGTGLRQAQAQSHPYPESTAGSAQTPWSPLCAPEGHETRETGPWVCRTQCVTFLGSSELQFPCDHYM